MTSSTDFHKLSEDCVRRFLHSVVAVDDNMSLELVVILSLQTKILML